LYHSIAFNQFINPWALDAMGWKYYLVYCAWLVFELLFVLKFIVETKGRTLEETVRRLPQPVTRSDRSFYVSLQAALFDGDRPALELMQQGGDAATMQMGRDVLSGVYATARTGGLHVTVSVEKSDDSAGEVFEMKHKEDGCGSDDSSGYAYDDSSEVDAGPSSPRSAVGRAL
jgi:hypothetical protein